MIEDRGQLTIEGDDQADHQGLADGEANDLALSRTRHEYSRLKIHYSCHQNTVVDVQNVVGFVVRGCRRINKKSDRLNLVLYIYASFSARKTRLAQPASSMEEKSVLEAFRLVGTFDLKCSQSFPAQQVPLMPIAPQFVDNASSNHLWMSHFKYIRSRLLNVVTFE